MLESKKALSIQLLDKDLAELSYDIQFLDAQVNADVKSYAPRDHPRATAKISFLRQKSKIIVLELDLHNIGVENKTNSL